jgi:predicted DNA-binding protein
MKKNDKHTSMRVRVDTKNKLDVFCFQVLRQKASYDKAISTMLRMAYNWHYNKGKIAKLKESQKETEEVKEI